MEERVSFWRGVRPLVGTAVGVGFFSLPYVFAQAGYGIALLELIVLAAVQIIFLWIYADLSLIRKDHGRFLHIIGDTFGPFGKSLSMISFFGALWGAMIAYILAGGEFLSFILRAWFSVDSHVPSLVLGGVLMIALLGGAFTVRAVQRYLFPFFFCVIAILAAVSFASIDVHNLATISPHAWVLPLGVILFSLSAISAIPEMRDELLGDRQRLRQAIFWGIIIIASVYAFFSAIVVGIAGPGTSEQAIATFARIAPWTVLLGSLLGFTTITTAYVNIGAALMNTLLYDFKFRYISAWAFIGGVPFFAVLFGVKDVVTVVQYAGGVMSALLGILVLLAYEKIRRERRLPRTMPAVAPRVVFGIFAVFFVMLVMTLRG